MSDVKPEANAAASNNNASSSGNPSSEQKPSAASEGHNKQDTPKKEASNVDKKKQKQAEKAARRAAQKADGPSKDSSDTRQTPPAADGPVAQDTQQKKAQHHKRTPSGKDQQLPVRPRRPSQSTTTKPPPPSQPKPAKPKPKTKQHPSLTHLYPHRRRPPPTSLLHPPPHKEVHPQIQTLALHLESYRLCGSQSRTIALLLALQSVIATYSTPPATSLPRHLSSAYLSPQLHHVKAYGRPFCTAQSNAVRWLKNRIATLDPGMPESTAINALVGAIDEFVRERFTVADRVIAQSVAGSAEDVRNAVIDDGDAVLVYGKSAVVCASLREAARVGKRFSVVCADGGRPLWEGRAMAQSLITLKVPSDELDRPQEEQSRGGVTSVAYVPISQLHAYLMHNPVNIALLGANTVYSNGSVLSRAGQAQAALAVRTECPAAGIYVLAESVKCAERAVLGTGALGVAELGPEQELVPSSVDEEGKAEDVEDGGWGVWQKGRDASEAKEIGEGLKGWEDQDGLFLVNLLHDVTPPELIDAIYTEVGAVPPSSAAAVGRMVGVGGELGEV